MLLVGDVMTHSVVTLSPEMTLAEAAATLSTIGVSGAPVCDREGRLVGVFSQSDVVKLDGAAPQSVAVRELMTASVITVREGEPLRAAVNALATHGVHRLVVLGEDGHISGIITPMDIVRAIASGKIEAPGLSDRP